MVRSGSILGIGLAVAALGAFQVTGCGDSGGGTGSAGATGTAGTTGSGGTSSTGVAGTTGQGGTSSTGTAGASATGTGGTSSTGTGGTSTTGTGGTSATGTGGTSSTGTGGTGFGQPLCAGTVMKNGACTASDQQLCYKTCGPQSKGVKSETCTNGAYMEMDGCAFDPAGDYSCYKLPSAANTMCPAADMPPQAGQPCTVDMCAPCNTSGGLPGGMYKDSSAATKSGFCVCQPANAAGNRTWSCASDSAWPCTASGGAPGCS